MEFVANGFFSALRLDRSQAIFQMESTAGPAAVINEMLLQSHGGIIRVFPSTPGDWCVRFTKFRARGGFVVSASHEYGARTAGAGFNYFDLDSRPVRQRNGIGPVEIKSTVGGEYRVQNPWPNNALQVTDIETGVTVDFGPETIIAFSTIAGHTYRVEILDE